MEIKSPAYVWGFAIGAAVGIVLLAVGIRLLLGKRTKRSREYDERQKLAQGVAYKYGFYTLLIYLGVVALFDLMTGIRWCSLYTAAFIGVLVSTGVFGTVAIVKDAYFPFRENAIRYVWLFAALGAMNVAIGVVHLMDEGTFMEDGILSHSVINPVAGVLLLLLSVAMALKNAADRRAERETERDE